MASAFKQLALSQINSSTLGSIVGVSNKNFVDVSAYINKLLLAFEYNDTDNFIYLRTVKADHLIATEDFIVLSGDTEVIKAESNGTLTTKQIFSEFAQSDKTVYTENADALNHVGILGEVIYDGTDFYGYTPLGWRGFTTGTGTGSINDASNYGLLGIGLFDSKFMDVLRFKNLNAGSSKITITDNLTDRTLEIDANISKSDVGLSLVPNINATNPSNITQDSTHRFVTDAEKAAWNLNPSATFQNSDLDGNFYLLFTHNLGALGGTFTVTDPNGYKQPVMIKDLNINQSRIEFGGSIDVGTWIIRGRL